MKKILTSMMCAALALLTSSCLQMHSTISLNKDGSGTVTETVTLGAQMLAMMAGFGGEEGQNPLESMVADAKKDAESKAKELGEGVTLKQVTALDEGGKKGVVIVFAFEDINKLKYVPGGAMQGGMGGPDADGKEEKKDEPMKFTYKDGVLTLDSSHGQAKQDAKPEDKEEFDAAGMAMAKQMMADMRVTMKLEIPGGISETNATYVEGNTVTLFDMDMGEVLQNEEKFKELMSAQADSFAETKALMQGVDGVKFEPCEKLTVTLK